MIINDFKILDKMNADDRFINMTYESISTYGKRYTISSFYTIVYLKMPYYNFDMMISCKTIGDVKKFILKYGL